MAFALRSRPLGSAACAQRRATGIPRVIALRPQAAKLVIRASADSASTTTSSPTASVHSVSQMNELLVQNKNKLMIVMCKSSHCKPCKAFMPTYQQLAERFCDSVMLTITGDEAPELRALMKEWQIKATPTFRMYRGGELIETVQGTGNSKLLNAILRQLAEGERGRDWVDVTHDTVSDE